jgi:ribulose-phosphate 3-epimerase
MFVTVRCVDVSGESDSDAIVADARYATAAARVSASIMCADFRALPQQFRALSNAGVLRAHLDFGDGRFIRNFPLGVEVFSQLPPRSAWSRECHLMIEDPLPVLPLFAPKADLVFFHIEAAVDPVKCVAAIRERGAGAGIAISPVTPAEALLPVLALVDEVLVLSVEPGFAGSRFVPAAVEKVARVRALADRLSPGLPIAVDGAISARTIPDLASAGADRFVGGTSGLFLGGDLEANARALISCIGEALGERSVLTT